MLAQLHQQRDSIDLIMVSHEELPTRLPDFGMSAN